MLTRTLINNAAKAARAGTRSASSINANRFDDHALKAAVDDDTYSAFHQSLADGVPLDKKAANKLADAMKTWAEERGATTFAHWFS